MSAEGSGRLLSVAACVGRDLLGRRHGRHPARAHLLGALEWLGRAQDATGGAGVSFAFGLKRGWRTPYPETTGYLIPTLYAASDRLEDARWADRADRMARWLVELQMADGSYPGGTVDLAPRAEVFNTGMIIFGLVAAHCRGGQDRYLQSAERAADWLVATQDADGAWSRHSYQGVAHTYHTRVAWALLRLHDRVPRPAFRDAARRQLRWAAGQQSGNGWLELCAFQPDVPPFTHTLAYAVRGMLECGLLLGDGDLVDRADRATRAVLARYEADGFLGARYDGEWRTSDRYACLTGCAQFACLWFRLFEVDGDRRWLEAAQRLTSYVASTQDLASRHPGIRGGIKGSLPVWGGYLPFRYPNWAAKFFVDALLLEERLAPAVPGADAGPPPCRRTGLKKRRPIHTDIDKVVSGFTAVADTQYGAQYCHPPESHAFFRSVLQAALARLATAPPVRVLEIGCGNGYWLREAAATTAAAGLQVSLAGVDLTPALIECARQQLQDLDPMPELSLGDILAAGRSDSCHLCYAYDLVQQIDGRDHLPMLEHLRSALLDGGVCVLFDRDPWSRYGLKMRLRKALTRWLGLNLVPEFYLLARYPSFGRLARLARRIGLQVVEDRSGAGRRALVLQR